MLLGLESRTTLSKQFLSVKNNNTSAGGALIPRDRVAGQIIKNEMRQLGAFQRQQYLRQAIKKNQHANQESRRNSKGVQKNSYNERNLRFSAEPSFSSIDVSQDNDRGHVQ